MKRLLTIIASTLFITQSYSQVQEFVNYRIDIIEGMPKAEVGTYQFIIVNPKFNPAYTTDILFFIERERKEDQDVVISISDYVDLYIPSRKKIQSKDFEPLDEIIN